MRLGDEIYEDLKTMSIKLYKEGDDSDLLIYCTTLPIEEVVELTEYQGFKVVYHVGNNPSGTRPEAVELKFGPLTMHVYTKGNK